jgi:type IX secretion system PorP/SprF family membrane protein
LYREIKKKRDKNTRKMKRVVRKIGVGIGVTVVLVAGVVTGASAQREVLYEQYLQNPMAINPAFTGIRQDFNMTATLRRRWFSMPNSPVSQTFFSDGTVANGKVGIGLQALNDRMSAYQNVGIYASGAYHHDLSATWKLSFGAQGGVNVLPVGDGSGYYSNRALASVGVGVWLQSDVFYAGVSKPEILSEGFGINQTVTFAYQKPLYITIGGKVGLNEDFYLLPSLLLVQQKDKDFRVDVGSRLWYDEKIGIGASYRMGDIQFLQLSGEVQLGRNIRLGYIYNSKPIEFITNSTGASLAPISIHELMIKFIPSPTRFHYN